MQVVLMFRPTRTREYTRTPDDFVNDLLVPRAKLEAACVGDAAQQEAGQRLIKELQADVPPNEIQYRLTYEAGIFQDGLQKHLNDAIRCDWPTLEEVEEGAELPITVHVVLRSEQYRAWGGQLYDQLFGHSVHATAEQAAAQLRPGYNYSVVEMPLLGVPVNAA